MKMKKIVLILGMILSFGANVWADDASKDGTMLKIQQETEKYKKECFENEAFPKGLNNYSMYNDDIKEGNYRYHQCLKKVIIKKINEIVAPEYAKEMISDLDKIQDGILDFYWILYTREDNGTIGRDVNDATLGRRFEDILEDIIYYQAVYKSN